MKLINKQWGKSYMCVFAFSLMLIACGGGSGGGGSSDGDSSDPLSVVLPDDRTVAERSEIALLASASGGTQPYTYTWTTQPADFESALSATDAASVMFTAPEVPEPTEIIVTVAVADGNGSAITDIQRVTVSPISAPPIVEMYRSTPEQDVAFTVDSGEGFELSANWIDPEDGTDVQSALLLVEQIAGSPVGTLPIDGVRRDLMANGVTPPVFEIIALNEFVNSGDSIATLEFTLQVTDNSDAVTESTVQVDILPTADSRPIVDAGHDQIAFAGQNITLQGAANVNTSNLSETLLWRQTSGQSVITLTDPLNAITHFTAPSVAEMDILEFTLSAVNANGQSTDTVLVTVLPISPFDGLNDTGVINCGSDTSNLVACSSSIYPNQDAENGRDPASNSNALNKRGQGESGFDFTMIDANGDEITANNTTASCVRDNVTELIWQVKTASGINAYNSSFSWFSDTAENNGGFEGTLDGGVCTQQTGVLVSCDTFSYVNAVNASGLCGANDWRMPTAKEFMSIMNFSRSGDLFARDESGNDIWASHASSTEFYWTEHPSLVGISNAAVNAWAVDTSTGNDKIIAKSARGRVLLVRGGK